MTKEETQIASCLARYEPALAKAGKASRAKLRARLPGLNEIVYMYEKQEAFVISYSPSEHGKDGVCALRLSPDGLSLYFTQGAALSKSDTGKLLQGSGAGVRHVPLRTAAELDHAGIEALILAALKLARLPPDASGKGSVIMKVEEQKKRADKAARPAPKKRSAKGAR